MFQKSQTFSFISFLVLSSWLVLAGGYQVGDPIRIMVNKVSPFVNPIQSYKYAALPFCMPKDVISYSISFADKLFGNSKLSSVYQTKFGINSRDTIACQVRLNERQVKTLRAAVRQNFVFEMFIEDITVGNSLGYVQDDKTYLNTHLNFFIYFNKQQGKLIGAHVNTEEGRHYIDITDGESKSITYTYSIVWIESALTSETPNMGLNSFFSKASHHMGYLNAILINCSLISVVWLLLQKLNKNEANYLPFDNEYEKRDSDSHWKAGKLEAFFTPAFKSLLSAMIGTGIQLTITIISLLFIGNLGVFDNNQSSILVTGIIIYTLTSIVGGKSSANFFRYMGGKNNISNSIFTALYFPVPLLLLNFIFSLIAWRGSFSVNIPIGTFVTLVCIWLLGVLPLTVLGGLIESKKMKETSYETERFSKAHQSLLDWKHYKSSIFIILFTGLLSFSALHFELYYLLTAIWTRKIYTMYSSFLVVFTLTMNISALSSIFFTYYQLNNKDFKWWWKSFLYGGSCGLYIFLYAIYFYAAKTHMSGYIQLLYYFSFSAIFAIVAFLVYGTAGFIGASAFVKHLYERHKVD